MHWPSVRGRARADAWPLLLAGVVVATVTLLAGAVPPLLRATADRAVQDAATRAGTEADVFVRAPWERDDGPYGGRVRDPLLPEELDQLLSQATDALGPELDAVLRPPVATATSPVLRITDGSVQRTFQLTYLAGATPGSPQVTWIAGRGPGPTVTGSDSRLEVPSIGPPWPVQIGLSEANASALGAKPGDRIPLQDEQRQIKDVRVSGIFRPTDPDDQAWRLAPWLLRPVPGADGVGSTRLAGLVSRGSLPDARLAFGQDQFPPLVRLAPDPAVLTWDAAQSIAATVVTLKATSGSSSGHDDTAKWDTQLDGVLRAVQAQISAASAQASVLLVAVLAAAVLILLLSAELLVRRRVQALAAARQRGAALPDLAAELLLESLSVALVAAAIGLGLARLVAPGVSWAWALPVFLAGAAAAPAFGTLAAARATRDRRAPANRSARRWAQRTGQLRRITLEVAVGLAAVGALVALHQRGILPPTGSTGVGADPDGAGLPAGAPVLGILAGGLVLLRLLPAATALVLRRSLRSRHPLAMFGAARAAATSNRVLPLLVLVLATGLASFALTLGATAGRGLADGSWRTVGAEARLDVADDAAGSTAAVATRLAAVPGVDQVVTGQVRDHTRMATGTQIVVPRLVVVDAAAYRRLLASTPLPDTPDLDRLPARTTPVPALVRSGDGSLRPGTRLHLVRENAPAVPLVAIGTAPPVGDTEDVVIVDTAALAAAGEPVAPETIWLTGPGAARAVQHAGVAADAIVRADVLAARTGAPLTDGLLRLARAAAAVLLALALLGLALGAAAGSPDRWQTLTRLRTLGLRPSETRWVAAGELLPPVTAASACGPLLGVLLAALTFGPLSLRVLTGQTTDPSLVLPWWALVAIPLVLLAAVAVVVPVESALRRRRLLGEVLRAGEG